MTTPQQLAEQVREALRRHIYETTCLCCEEADGSHKPIITKECLRQSRQALPAIDELIRVLGEQAKQDGWQPIETAPKGVEIMLWADGWLNPSSGCVDAYGEGYSPADGVVFYPLATHWMLLPAPPTTEKE